MTSERRSFTSGRTLFALALVVAMTSCRRKESSSMVTAGPDAHASATAAPCSELRAQRRVVNPDYPSERNSDGTPKQLPPGPPNDPGHTLVLPYFAFGPQAMSFTLLGMSWWSWEAGGSFEPGDEFDVRVVVYRGRTRQEVEARYPTVRGKSDYRIVSRADALRYLDEGIAELASMSLEVEAGEEDFPRPLRRDLEHLRSTIRLCLP